MFSFIFLYYLIKPSLYLFKVFSKIIIIYRCIILYFFQKLYDGLKKNNYYLYKDNFIKTEYTNEKDNKKIIDSPLQNKMLRQLTELNKY